MNDFIACQGQSLIPAGCRVWHGQHGARCLEHGSPRLGCRLSLRPRTECVCNATLVLSMTRGERVCDCSCKVSFGRSPSDQLQPLGTHSVISGTFCGSIVCLPYLPRVTFIYERLGKSWNCPNIMESPFTGRPFFGESVPGKR